MNALLLNRDGFQTPADGWYQVAPMGEFVHAQAGLTQVVDSEGCAAMANRFAEEAKAPNFAGLLVDFDHFSLDGEKRSEAAGWITALEARETGASGQASGANGEPTPACGHPSMEGTLGNGAGLFAKIRWSDVGESAVKGGRYRFLSPVWNRADCVDLGGGRVRPVRLLNAAVTNDPNLKGMRPLSNRQQASGDSRQGENANVQHPTSNVQRRSGDGAKIANAVGDPRFKWTLGDTPEGRHCPSCAAVAGQVHTMAEWDAAGVKPGSDGLLCQGNCQCQLVPTDEPSGGPVVAGPMRKITNTGWTDEARAVSLAVRQAKAGTRGDRNTRLQERQRDSMDKAGRDYAAIYETKGLKGMTAEEVAYLAARISVKVRNGSKLTDPEERFVKERGLSASAANRGRVGACADALSARRAQLANRLFPVIPRILQRARS